MGRRSENYTADEKDVLITLVDRYKGVIECKKTDQVMLREKDECWSTVETEFNLSFPTRRRSVEQLKQCWRNIKGSTKKLSAKIRRDKFATGGGPPVTETFNAIDNRVMAMVPGQMNPLPCQTDSDAMRAEYTPNGNVERDIPTTSREQEFETPTSPINDPINGKRAKQI